MLFSTRINLSQEPPVSEHSTTNRLVRNATRSSEFGSSPLKHQLVGSLEVPEHFCNRRSSYCDQDEDEDKTDLEGKQSMKGGSQG